MDSSTDSRSGAAVSAAGTASSGASERYFVDGRPVELDHFVLRGDDPGFTLGLNVFETMRTYSGVIFRLDLHLQRLIASADSLGVPLPDEAVLRSELAAATRSDEDSRIRVAITRGGRRLVHAGPLDQDYVGATLRVVRREWEPPAWLGGRVKHGSRAFTVSVVESAGVDEVFWVDRNGYLLEGGRSSIWAVVDGRLKTPPDDGRILAGVTRAALLEAAAAAGLPADVEPIRADAAFTELYASSTLRELGAVVEIDGEPLPGGGPLGDALHEAFDALCARETRAARGAAS